MKIRILLSIFAVLFLSGLTPADVIPTNPDQMVVINLRENYPDYSFYMCHYDITPNANYNNEPPDATARIYKDRRLIDFSLIKLSKLSPGIPYIQRDVLRHRYEYYLVAVKKEIEDQRLPALEESVIKLAFTMDESGNRFMISDNGVYLTGISKFTGGNLPPVITVNEVIGIDQDGLKLRQYDGKYLDLRNVREIETAAFTRLIQICSGILIAFGITFGIIWILRIKKSRKEVLNG